MRAGILEFSERWFRLLLRLYPRDFQDEMGNAVVEAYMDRSRDALKTAGTLRLTAIWLRALFDSLRNGFAERLSPAASWRRPGDWGRDVELAGRRLLRSPGFAFSAIGTLTVGLALFAGAYTAVQRLLIDPLPYQDPGGLYMVWRDYRPSSDQARGALAGTDVAELRKAGGAVEDAAGLQAFLGGIFALREGDTPQEIAVTRVTPNLFRLLGATPMLGRTFAPGETGKDGVIVLTHTLWNRLGANRAIVGAEVRLQGRPHTVIGVMPPGFTFVRNEAAAPPQRVEAFIPFDRDLTAANPKSFAYAGIIRARTGTAPEAVAAAVGAVGRIVDARDFNGRGVKLYPVGLKADVISRIRPALVVLGAAALVLLFMLTVNLASVLLARAAQREHEVAVSRALGASSSAIAGSLLLEGALLGCAGGLLGAIVAHWGIRALASRVVLDLPRSEALALDWRVAAVVVCAGVLLGLLAAVAPALWAVRSSLSALLAGSAVRGGGGYNRLRRAMIVAQVALSFMLLASGAVVARSFERLLRVDPGFHAHGVFTVRLRTPPEFFPTTRDAIAFQERVQQALATIPGVSGTSATSALPLTAVAFQTQVTFPGAPGNTGDPERDNVRPDITISHPNYLEVMQMRLIMGRSFAPTQLTGATEAIIDKGLAHRFFPGSSPIGATVRLSFGSATVVGVAEQVRLYDFHSEGRPQVLVRTGENFDMRPAYFVMRTTREPNSLLPEVQAAVRRVAPRIPVGNPESMDDIVARVLGPQTMGASLLGVFSVGALLLATMGLYGVVSGSVTRRRHELAVRLALGAGHQRVLGLVVKEGMLLVAVGLLLGAPGILVAHGLIRGLLVGVTPSDPVSLLASGLALVVVTMLTCYVPARSILRIDPARLLRQD